MEQLEFKYHIPKYPVGTRLQFKSGRLRGYWYQGSNTYEVTEHLAGGAEGIRYVLNLVDPEDGKTRSYNSWMISEKYINRYRKKNEAAAVPVPQPEV